jgi:hypothetical protein
MSRAQNGRRGSHSLPVLYIRSTAGAWGRRGVAAKARNPPGARAAGQYNEHICDGLGGCIREWVARKFILNTSEGTVFCGPLT